MVVSGNCPIDDSLLGEQNLKSQAVLDSCMSPTNSRLKGKRALVRSLR
jgi:hypothetical protein